MKKLIPILLLVIISVCTSGEDYITAYTRTNYVFSMSVIDDILWLCTAGGLVKYDPVADTSRIYHKFNTGIPEQDIQLITKDYEGSYWMNAGYSYYLYIMKGDEWKIYDRPNFKAIPPGGGAEGIVNDKSGNIWLKSGQYIRRLKGENFDKSYYLPDYGFSSSYIISMVFDLNNALWLSISMNNGKYDIIKIVEDTLSFRLSSTDMLSGRKNPKLAIDSMNNVWISTDSGLTKYDGRTFTDYNKSNTIIKVQRHQYMSAGAKYLWVSGTDSTIYKYDYIKNIWYEIKLKRYPDSEINGLIAYKDKALISRHSLGLEIVDSTATFLKKFHIYSNSLPYYFDSFSFDRYNRMIGMRGKYIYVIGQDFKIEKYYLNAFDYDYGTNIKFCIDSSDRVWCISENSLIRLNQDFSQDSTLKYPTDNGQFKNILAIDKQKVYLLKEKQLFMYDGYNWQKEELPEIKDCIYQDLAYDKSKNLSVLGTNGIFTKKDTNWVFKRIGKEVELPSHYFGFYNIIPDNKGGYYLIRGGLKSLFHFKDSVLKKIDLKIFSDYDDIKSITMDNMGKLWICNDLGVVTYDGEKEKNIFYKSTYLSSSAIDNYHNIWLSTDDGFIKIINDPGLPDNFIKNTKLNYLVYNPINKKHDREVPSSDMYEFMPDNPICRSIRSVGYFRNDTKDRYLNFRVSGYAYDKNKPAIYYEEYLTVDSASLTNNPDIKVVDDNGKTVPFNKSHGLPPGMTARVVFPVFECPEKEKSPSPEISLCISSINMDLDTGYPFPLEDVTDDTISRNINLVEIADHFDFKESFIYEKKQNYTYISINNRVWSNSGSEIGLMEYISDFGTNSINVLHNADSSITLEDKDYPLLTLNRMKINTQYDEAGQSGGDKLISQIIDFRDQYGAYLKIDFSRKLLINDENTRRGFSLGYLAGPERRVISSDSISDELNNPDKLIIEFIAADEYNLKNVLNPKEEDWITYEIEPGNKVKGIPALSIYGGGGYSTGFDENVTDSILDERTGLRENIYDLGIDSYYKSLQVPLPDFIIEKGFIRFRIRVEAKNNATPYTIRDDEDNFCIKDIKLQKATGRTDLGITQLLFDTPYSVIPRDHNVQIPIKIRIKNNLMTSSPKAKVRLIIKNDTDSSFDSSNISNGYDEIIEIPMLNAYESKLIDCPNLLINDAYYNNMKSFLRILAYLDSPKGDMYPENDSMLATYVLRKGDAFAYDSFSSWSNVADETNIIGRGLNMFAYSSPDYNSNLAAGDIGGSGSGQIAIKFDLADKDTIFGFCTYYDWINSAFDDVLFSIYSDENGLPGAIIDGSQMYRQRCYDDSKENYDMGEYVKSLYKDPLIIPKGTYWASITQLGETGFELGGSGYRMGMVTPVCDMGDGTKSKSIFINKYFTDESYDDVGKIKLENRGLFAYRNLNGKDEWVNFSPTNGNPAYAHLNKTGRIYRSLDSVDTFTRGTWVPMLRVFMDGQYYKPNDVKDEISNNISISPNPATDYIEINLGRWTPSVRWSPSDLTIYNSLGECVITPLAFGEGTGVRLDISTLPPGVYFIRINNGNEMQTGSFVVLR